MPALRVIAAAVLGRGAEIAGLRWWPHHRGLRIAPAVRDGVLPRLGL